MEIVLVNGVSGGGVGGKAVALDSIPPSHPEKGFLWLDASHDEVTEDPSAWRDAVEKATGVSIYELHLKDVVNLHHPSYFDSTRQYEIIIFRKLALGSTTPNLAPSNDKEVDGARKIPPAIQRLKTVPVSFLLTEHALITVSPRNSRTIQATRTRLMEYQERGEGNHYGSRIASTPQDLMLRLINAMVDQYLELRQPLTSQLDRWQRTLLNPQRQFKDWTALLDTRNELHKLDHLCEEQHDALQELKDHFVDSYHAEVDSRTKDILLVRINDVMEHITRVLNHARRLESSLESAVQIHFAAVSHRTSEIMRTLTVLTALFMPLTFITGVFGMNFESMPLLKDNNGFWLTIATMTIIVAILLLLFRRKRYLED